MPSPEPSEAGYAFCHPFDDTVVIVGQGTLGLELVDEIDDLATVLVPSVAADWRRGWRSPSSRNSRPCG